MTYIIINIITFILGFILGYLLPIMPDILDNIFGAKNETNLDSNQRKKQKNREGH